MRDGVFYGYPECPLCDGFGVYMGILGLFAWFRCRNCGNEFSEVRRDADPEEGE